VSHLDFLAFYVRYQMTKR